MVDAVCAFLSRVFCRGDCVVAATKMEVSTDGARNRSCRDLMGSCLPHANVIHRPLKKSERGIAKEGRTNRNSPAQQGGESTNAAVCVRPDQDYVACESGWGEEKSLHRTRSKLPLARRVNSCDQEASLRHFRTEPDGAKFTAARTRNNAHHKAFVQLINLLQIPDSHSVEMSLHDGRYIP